MQNITLEEVQYLFFINLSLNGHRGRHLHIVKSTCEKLTADIIFNGEKQKAFPLTLELRPGCSLSPLQST